VKKIENITFHLKRGEDLSKDEENQLMYLSISEYPEFEKYYRKNKYYSTIKPQMEYLVKRGDKIIGSAKFLWKKIKIQSKKINFFALGVLISKEYQGVGIGYRLTVKLIEEARKRNADIFYCTTINPIAEKILNKLGFINFKTKVFYKDVQSKKLTEETEKIYLLEFTEGVLDFIKQQDSLHIGIGPI